MVSCIIGTIYDELLITLLTQYDTPFINSQVHLITACYITGLSPKQVGFPGNQVEITHWMIAI